VSNPEARRIEAWLEKRPEVTAILPAWKAQTRLASWPVDVVGLRPDETYRVHFPMLSAAEEAWDSVRRGGAVLISVKSLGIATPFRVQSRPFLDEGISLSA
jgi:putative ABC transport system permease protein